MPRHAFRAAGSTKASRSSPSSGLEARWTKQRGWREPFAPNIRGSGVAQGKAGAGSQVIRRREERRAGGAPQYATIAIMMRLLPSLPCDTGLRHRQLFRPVGAMGMRPEADRFAMRHQPRTILASIEAGKRSRWRDHERDGQHHGHQPIKQAKRVPDCDHGPNLGKAPSKARRRRGAGYQFWLIPSGLPELLANGQFGRPRSGSDSRKVPRSSPNGSPDGVMVSAPWTYNRTTILAASEASVQRCASAARPSLRP